MEPVLKYGSDYLGSVVLIFPGDNFRDCRFTDCTLVGEFGRFDFCTFNNIKWTTHEEYLENPKAWEPPAPIPFKPFEIKPVGVHDFHINMLG